MPGGSAAAPRAPSQRTISRKPSCLISRTQPGPGGGRSVGDGRQGSVNADTRMPGVLGHQPTSSTIPKQEPRRDGRGEGAQAGFGAPQAFCQRGRGDACSLSVPRSSRLLDPRPRSTIKVGQLGDGNHGGPSRNPCMLLHISEPASRDISADDVTLLL